MKQRPDFCKKIRSGNNIEPITPFEKNYALCWKFKKEFATKKSSEILDELCHLSFITINQKTPYTKRRGKKHPILKKCWVCKEKAFYQHHIIQIKNGGYDSGINRIPICKKCHTKIHPHLKTI